MRVIIKFAKNGETTANDFVASRNGGDDTKDCMYVSSSDWAYKHDGETMAIEQLENLTTAQEAKDFAIEWQAWQAHEAMSYSEISDWHNAFDELADKFNLRQEFVENGII